jgi:hypothetical protein
MSAHTALMALEARTESKYEEGNEKSYASIVDGFGGSSWLDARGFEGFESQFSEVASLPRITTWGFTGADQTVVSDLHSFDFRGMQTAGVVSTGSWSSPCSDDLSFDLQTHRVLGFDALDYIPSQSLTLQGIDNGDAFIEVDHTWTVEEQVSASQNKGAPQKRIYSLEDGSVVDGLCYETNHNKSGNRNGGVDASWAVEISITADRHAHIFSQDNGLEWSHS